MSRSRGPCGKETKALVARCQAAGATIERTRRNHWAVRYRGKIIGVIAGTPSDKRSHLNDVSQLRRAGLPI